jgi:HEAT repeat protein
MVAIAGPIALAAFSWASEKIGEGGLSLLGDKKSSAEIRRSLERAISEALVIWSKDNDALVPDFSTSFLQIEGAPVIGRFLTEIEEPDGVELALKLLESYGVAAGAKSADLLDRIEGPTCQLIDLIRLQLGKQPAYAPIRAKRESYRSAETDHNRAAQGGDLPTTSAMRRDYLRWVIGEMGSLTTRGISQSQVLAVSLPLESVYEPTELSPSRVTDLRADREFQRRLLELQLDGHILGAGREAEIERLAREFGAADLAESVKTLADAVGSADRVVLLGDPGMGKTTALRWIALQNARNVLLHSPFGSGSQKFLQQVPVLVRVADLAAFTASGGGPVRTFLVDDLVRRSCPALSLTAFLGEQLDDGSCIIMFDGLDEAVDPNLRRKTADLIAGFARSLAPGNRVIVSSRTAGYLAAPLVDPFRPYSVRPLSRPAIEHFLRSYCPLVEAKLSSDRSPAQQAADSDAQVTKLLIAIDRTAGVRHLAANPLLLTAMTLIGRNDAQLPNQRAHFYDRVVQTLATSWRTEQLKTPTPLDEQTLHRVLRQAAWHLRENKPAGTITGSDAKSVLGPLVGRKPWTDAIDDEDLGSLFGVFLRSVDEHSGLLVERTEGHYAFAHLTFEEFYAAQQLRDRPSDIRTRRHRSRWEEPILLALGLMTPERAEETIHGELLAEPSPHEHLLFRDHVLVARAMTDGIEPLPADASMVVEQIVHAVIRLRAIPSALTQGLVQRCAGGPAAPILDALVDALSDDVSDVRSNAATALSGATSEPRIIDALLGALTDKDNTVRARAADALSAATSEPRVIDALIAALIDKDNDNHVRAGAAGALSGATSEPRVIDALIAAFTDDENYMVSGSAAGALNRATLEPRVIDALIASLSGEFLVRARAANLLGNAASEPRVIDALLAALTDKDRDNTARASAADALRDATSGPPVVDALLEALTDKDNDNHVRASAAGALSNATSEPRVIDALLAALTDEDNDVRAEAAGALGDATSKHYVIGALVAALDADKDNNVRVHAAGALGNATSEPRVIDALVTALDADNDSNVRAHAASVLGNAASEPRVVDTLITALTDKDNDNHVRAWAAGALSNASSEPRVIDALITALTDNNDDVRGHAAGALGNPTSEPHVIDALLAALTDSSDNAVRWIAASALGNATSEPRVIDALIAALTDDQTSVRATAADALRRAGSDLVTVDAVVGVADRGYVEALTLLRDLTDDRSSRHLSAPAEDEWA